MSKQFKKFFPAAFAFASILWFAHGALAADVLLLPDYFHPPTAGVSQITPHVGYRFSSITYSGGANYTQSGLDRLGVSYVYGLTDMWSIGADLSYSSLSTSGAFSNKLSGIEPLGLTAEGVYPLSEGKLIFGLDATFGLEKATVSASGDVNRSYGDPETGFGNSGLKVGPFIGYSTAMGDNTFGGKIRWNVIDLNSTVTVSQANGTSVDGTIGSENAGRALVFYEYHLSDMPLGAAIVYDWMGAPAISGTNLIQSPGKRSLVGLDLYTAMPVNTMLFKPSVEWREKASADNYDKLSDVHLNLAMQMSF